MSLETSLNSLVSLIAANIDVGKAHKGEAVTLSSTMIASAEELFRAVGVAVTGDILNNLSFNVNTNVLTVTDWQGQQYHTNLGSLGAGGGSTGTIMFAGHSTYLMDTVENTLIALIDRKAELDDIGDPDADLAGHFNNLVSL